MYYYGRDKRRRFKRRLKVSLITLGIITLIGASYFLYSVSGTVTENVASVDPVENGIQARQVQTNSTLVSDEKGASAKSNAEVAATNQDAGKTSFSVESRKDGIVAVSRNGQKQIGLKSSDRSLKEVYEVISEAHFYNHPSEQSRRKEFIPYWNMSQGSIKPIEEKNGFLYVLFKYPTGEMSKGWLRKKDLQKVNTAYDDNKG